MPPSLREWLPEDHLAWFVIDAVEEMDLAAFYAAYRDGRARSGGARSGDDGGAVALRLRDRGAVVAADRAALRRGRRHAGDLRQPGARSHDDRAVSPAPRGGAGRAVRRGARAVRRGRVGQRGGDRDRRHQGARQRVAARQPRLRADRARDPRGGRRGRRRRGRAVRRRARRRAAAGAGHRARAGAGWLREAKRRLDDSAPRRPGRSRAHGPSGCGRPSAGWRKSTGSSATPTPTTRPTGRAGGCSDGRRFGAPPQALPAAGDAGRARSTSPIRTRATSRPRAAGCRATTPRPSSTSTRS